MAIEQKPGAKVGAPPSGGSTSPGAAPASRLRYVTETWTELKKTTWPPTPEAHRLTLVVIGVILVVGTYMGTLDWILSTLVNKFSLIK